MLSSLLNSVPRVWHRGPSRQTINKLIARGLLVFAFASVVSALFTERGYGRDQGDSLLGYANCTCDAWLVSAHEHSKGCPLHQSCDSGPQPILEDIDSCVSCDTNDCGEFNFFVGIEGSKQPQDFGVSANFGGRTSLNWSRPLLRNYGIGFQIGTAINATTAATRVNELLGEDTQRYQSFTTLGLFQRLDNGWFWGVGYDFLFQDTYDQFQLGQWRMRGGKTLNANNEVGMTIMLPGDRDTGFFNATQVSLDPIAQGTLYWRHFWQSGAQTTVWGGIAEGHGESNAITGFSPAQDEVFVFGADILCPLNNMLAIYGETNLMMPADTGTVDAFLGLQFFPGGAYQARRQRYSPVLPVAGSTSFSVDLQ